MGSPLSVVPRVDAVTIRVEGERVLVIREGRAILDMSYRAAEEVGRALIAAARRVEEVKKAETIALDQALLIRKGVPIGLTSHPKIQAEAAKEAAWNRDLRRYLPGGVKSEEQFGTPAVIRHLPPKKELP